MQASRLALVQTDWPGDRPTLIERYRQLVRRAADAGATLVCLQEFSLSPYFASEIGEAGFRWAEPLRGGPSDRVFGELARENRVFLVGSLFERDAAGAHWDTATLHGPDGTLIGQTRKVHIPQGAGYHEDHYFRGGAAFPVHDIGALKLSIPTCYDQWFPELSRICALNGAELIVYPTAIGSEPTAPDVDTREAWQTVMRGQAIANGVYIAAVNRIGEEGVTFYGSSFVCDPMGRIVAQASRDRTEILIADLDPARFDEWRRLFPLLQQRRPDTYARLVEP